MPLKRQKINDYGIRIDYRTYDATVLNPYRGERSAAADGLWEIHYNPHASGQVWVRLPRPGQPRGWVWEEVPWIHGTLVTAPFTDFTWQYVQRAVAPRADRTGHGTPGSQAVMRWGSVCSSRLPGPKRYSSNSAVPSPMSASR
ncbi:Mu transposase C-terminal domain-containing protein [Streptomyces sp. NPDC059533]|uniref:Mu transposase C-terminal domain-containing protein n=1 Tax=unclassified Streptomyces TaxID=2593676 RepID=UPI003698C360